MAFTADDLKQEILLELGDDKMPVEIGEKELNVCITRALEKYSMYKPLTYNASYKANIGNGYSGFSGYYGTKPIDIHTLPPEVLGVRSVEITAAINTGILSGLQVENALINGVPVYLGSGELTLDIDYLSIRRQWLKTVSRQLASDPSYQLVRDPITNLFTIFTFSTSPTFVGVEATMAYSSDLTNIPHYNRYWIHGWVRMEAKKIIGSIRSKYSHIPVAGQNMKLNGELLMSEARAEEKQLLDELQSTRADLVPHWA
jgi:hypothetical protein